MTEHELKDEFDGDADLRSSLGSADGGAPSVGHDRAVLASARAAAGRIRARRGFEFPRLRLAVPLLASFALGAVATFLLNHSLPPLVPVEPKVTEQLSIPIRVASRDASAPSREIPVEQADPQVWYRYIQELIYAGDRVQAERHLKRFNQLHPDFIYRP